MSEETENTLAETQENQEAPPSEPAKKPRSRARTRKDTGKTSAAASKTSSKKKTETNASEDGHDSMDRAEQIVQEWTIRAEKVGTDMGHQVMKILARAREEAEDIWAEAQQVRQRSANQRGEDQP